jgi:hypothetical protein
MACRQGHLHYQRNDFNTAFNRFIHARNVSEAVDDPHLHAAVNEGLGLVYLTRQCPADAALHLQHAIERYETVGDHHHAIIATLGLARAIAANGHPARAHEILNTAIAHIEHGDNPPTKRHLS